MQENHRARLSFIQTGLPWAVAGAALVLYLITLSRWVTLDSLPFVAKVTGWDWTLPYQTPLFFLLTYPFRFLPGAWQPVALNVFSAVCSALTLALLVRSVALLPHDRTHEQRLRERSEFSLLSIPAAWLPPILAALVCGLELTFWEHSTAATNESLDLLLFAFVIRCLLEFRLEQKESWLTRMSFVYGLGVTNSFAMIGFFPCILAAVLWIKGRSFFEFRFFLRMLACGLLGLSLYLLLPVVWAMSDNPTVTFWQALHANLTTQKMSLWDMPNLRSRALILCLTSLVPITIIGIRWPSTFGDTSAAGALAANMMFRVVHIVFFVAGVVVAMDLPFSPRAVGAKLAYAPPFLTFYYLGALSVGYFAGYLLLVFGESSRSKARHRRTGGSLLLNRLVVAAIWAALIAAPTALVVRNWKNVRTTNGPVLRQFTDLSTQALPEKGAIVMSDDPYTLLLLSARLSSEGALNKHLLVHTRALIGPDYHRELTKRYPGRWPNFFADQPADEVIDDGSLLQAITLLSKTNEIYYLHPSFGYYFEQFYMEPHGLVYQLQPYPSTNTILPPELSAPAIEQNHKVWTDLQTPLANLATRSSTDSRDANYVRRYYSRALNFWGVTVQRQPAIKNSERLEVAGKWFDLAAELNTNNVPAQSNAEFNRAMRTGKARTPETSKSIEDKFGAYRGWERMLVENGPFDHPDFCLRLGQIFAQQALYRQALTQLDRVRTMEPSNIVAQLAMADVYTHARLPQRAVDEVAKIRSSAPGPLVAEVDIELARIEATALFGLSNVVQAERVTQEAYARHPNSPGILDTLLQIYAQTGKIDEALKTAETIIAADPSRSQSYINQATLYLNKNEPARAIASIERVLEKSPQQPQALLYKIFLLIQAKEYGKANAAIDALLAVEPENLEALLYKGVVAIENKTYAPAIAPLTEVLKRQPNNANALRNRALAYLQLKDFSKAAKDYDAMRRLVTREFAYVAYYGLGDIAFKRGDTATARKYYTLYLQFAPKTDNPELVEEKKMVTTRLEGLKQARR